MVIHGMGEARSYSIPKPGGPVSGLLEVVSVEKVCNETSEGAANFRQFVTTAKSLDRSNPLAHPPVPHKIRRSVLLKERGADGFRKAWIVEQDAEIVSRLVATGLRVNPGAILDHRNGRII